MGKVEQKKIVKTDKKPKQATAYEHWALRLTDSKIPGGEVPKFHLIQNWLRSLGAKKWAFQQERGENGQIHWQISFSCGTPCKMRRDAVRKSAKNWIAELEFPNGDYCEETKSSAYERYCIKDDSRLEGPYVYGMAIPYLGQDLPKFSELYDWQRKILEIIEGGWEDRTIYWCWEEKGDVGKSKFAKYLAWHHNAMKVCGKKNDIYFAAGKCDIFVVDIPRTVEGRVPYEAIEELKNGHVFCGKYESCQKLFLPPHIIVFANFEPDYSTMSRDRWRVKHL